MLGKDRKQFEGQYLKTQDRVPACLRHNLEQSIFWLSASTRLTSSTISNIGICQRAEKWRERETHTYQGRPKSWVEHTEKAFEQTRPYLKHVILE